jgi:hypothetical protein
VRFHPAGEIQIEHAGLNAGAAIARIELKDAIHPGKGNEHPAGRWDGAAAQPGAGTACDERLAAIARDFYDCADVTRGNRQHNRRRSPAFRVGIEAIDREIFGCGFHRIASKRIDQPPMEHLS